MSIFRSRRRQRRTVAESIATTFPVISPAQQGWPVVHADNCRCTYCR